MKAAFREFVRGTLLSYGFAMEKSTRPDDVQKLIAKLRPQDVGIDLIRLGHEGDGGYLVPDDLSNISACFSPGVGQVSDFEKDCANLGMNVYLADKSVDELPVSMERFQFIRKFIGATVNDDYTTLDQWVKESHLPEDADLMLQMDIEGYEYLTIAGTSNALLERFRIIVVEFHELHKFWNVAFFQTALAAFDKLLQSHICVHIHPNNCCGVERANGISIPRLAEFTFVRKDRIKGMTARNDFPHELDFDNTDKEHLSLPKEWYQ